MCSATNPMSRETRIYIAGHRGLVGSALWRHFSTRGFENLVGRTSAELDLRDSSATANYFAETRPDVVIDAAALVGGIRANATRPATFFSDNVRIQVNLLDSALANGVERFLFLGSSCIYPKNADQPIREEALFTGPLEETNKGYAMAKLAGIAQVAAIRRQYGLPYICAMPASIYGPGDNFSIEDAHVVPAMIRRFHTAVQDGARRVTCWGTGRPRRELMHVNDLADASQFLLDSYDGDMPVNVGTGKDLSIAELADLVADVVGYRGEICWNADKPDGTFRKLLEIERLNKFGWSAKISLSEGIRSTYEWFLAHQGEFRR